MKTLTGIVLLGTALALSACGGDSDSSGDTNSSSYRTFGKVLPKTTCKVDGALVDVPAEGCVFSLQYPSQGEDVTYTQRYQCIKDNKVSDGTVYGYSLSFGKYYFRCAR